MTAASSKHGSSLPRLSLLVGLIAVSVTYVLTRRAPIVFSNGTQFPSLPLPSFLTDDQKATFRETGVLFLPSLLQGDMLKDAVEAGEYVYQKPSLMSFLFRSVYAKLTMQEWRSKPGFARVAFESSMSSIAADLMNETKSMRILKDALFGQTNTGIGSGFHVDDKGFWPAEDDVSGVNFWVALSDYSTETGGGIRVAPGSHKADWALECRQAVIGYTDKTGSMRRRSPECDNKMNDMSVVYDMKPGDAVIWDRWIFHRQEHFKKEVGDIHKLRYTIRYVPSNARAPVNGIMMHPSVELGKPFDTPYHPQVWPTALAHEIEAVQKGLAPDFTQQLIFSNGAPFPSSPLPSFLTDEQKTKFRETGVLLLPGLLQGDLLKDAIEAGEYVFRKPTLFSYLFKSAYAKLTLQEWRSTPGFTRVAFESSMSSIAADLMNETKSMRILMDAVFGQTSNGMGCGFHVDDKGFWPAEDDSNGVNFWVALSDYTNETGGGIRVALGSHTADWAPACREVISGSPTKTCAMSKLSPDCDGKLNDSSTVYDMKPGDAILWDRWMFHRQESFKDTVEGVHKLRYTIRYVPSNARAAVNGFSLHPSIERGQPFNTPYHPQVWPTTLREEMEAIQKGLDPQFTTSQLVMIVTNGWVKKAKAMLRLS